MNGHQNLPAVPVDGARDFQPGLELSRIAGEAIQVVFVLDGRRAAVALPDADVHAARRGRRTYLNEAHVCKVHVHLAHLRKGQIVCFASNEDVDRR